MIQLTDMTLNESSGNYRLTCDIMDKDVIGDWMLDTKCHVATEAISSMFQLHLWKNGRIVIWETDRPIDFIAPDDDLVELSAWAKENGWKELTLDSRLLVIPREFEFWQRMYLRGLIMNDELKTHEEEEIKRLQEGIESEDDDDI